MRKLFIVIFVILGGIIGCMIGEAMASVETFKWLAIGGEIGFKTPLTLDLSFLQLTFGIWCKINIAGVIGLILFAFLSNKVFKWIKI